MSTTSTTASTETYQSVDGINSPSGLSGIYTNKDSDLYSFTATIPNDASNFTFTLDDYGYSGLLYPINFVNANNGTAWGSHSKSSLYYKSNTVLPFANISSAHLPIPKVSNAADDSSPSPFKSKTTTTSDVYIYSKQTLKALFAKSYFEVSAGCSYSFTGSTSECTSYVCSSDAYGAWIYAQAGGGGGSGYSRILSEYGRGGGGGCAALVYLDCYGLGSAHDAVEYTVLVNTSSSGVVITKKLEYAYPCFLIEVGSGGAGAGVNSTGYPGGNTLIYSCIPSLSEDDELTWTKYLLVTIYGGSGGTATGSTGGDGGGVASKSSSSSDAQYVYIANTVPGGRGSSPGSSGSSISTSALTVPCSGDTFYPYRTQNSLQYGAGGSELAGGGGSSCGSPGSGAYTYGMGGSGAAAKDGTGSAGKSGVLSILESSARQPGYFNIKPPAYSNKSSSATAISYTITNNNDYSVTLKAYGITATWTSSSVKEQQTELYTKSLAAGASTTVSFQTSKYAYIQCKFIINNYTSETVSST